MSRCFPYPRPYLGEAEIESIKKEKEMLQEAAKRERKREKKEKRKKEKKEKRSGGERDLSKGLKKTLKRKYEELGLVEPKEKHDSSQHCHKAKKPRDEHLENSNSGLTEEHGQPRTVGPACCESPDRSQDSSTRRNLASMPSPNHSLTNSGSTIRIKLQAKSRSLVPEPQTSISKGLVSAPQLAKSRGQAPASHVKNNRQPVSVPSSSKVREQFSILKASKPSTSSAVQKSEAELIPQTLKTKAPLLHTPKSKEPVVIESVIPKPREVLPYAPRVVPKENGIFGPPKPQGAWKSEIGLVPSSSRSVIKEHVMKATLGPCALTQTSKIKEASQKPLPLITPKLREVTVSPVLNRDFIQPPVQLLNSKLRDVKAEPAPTSKPAPVVQQVLNAKQRVDGSAHGLKLDRKSVVPGIPSVATDEPCLSGRISEAGARKESKHHHKHSSSKTSKRKEAEKLFEDLITNWKPQVVDQFQEDVGDLDWLMSGAKKRRVECEQGEDWLSKPSTKCNAGAGLFCHTNQMAGPSYQTRATYVTELDLYQLPYVVPF